MTCGICGQEYKKTRSPSGRWVYERRCDCVKRVDRVELPRIPRSGWKRAKQTGRS